MHPPARDDLFQPASAQVCTDTPLPTTHSPGMHSPSRNTEGLEPGDAACSPRTGREMAPPYGNRFGGV